MDELTRQSIEAFALDTLESSAAVMPGVLRGPPAGALLQTITPRDTDFPLFLAWVREGRFPLAKLVTDRYSLEQAEEARGALEEGQILGRAIIEI